MSDLANMIAGEQASALRDIATAIGCPANVDPLTDLDGLVMMAGGLAERVVGVEARIADAVAGERAAIAEYVRRRTMYPTLTHAIESGYHIDDDKPPLPSLRMTLRDELLRQVETLTAERDELRTTNIELSGSIEDIDAEAAEASDHWAAEIGRLTAERDRRIEPVEHARAVMESYRWEWTAYNGMPNDSRRVHQAWLDSVVRATLIVRFGPEVLAEVER